MSTAAAAPATPAPRPRIVLSVSGIAHVASCPTVRGRGAWSVWEPPAEGKASRALAVACAGDDLRPCRSCKPIDRLARWERFG